MCDDIASDTFVRFGDKGRISVTEFVFALIQSRPLMGRIIERVNTQLALCPNKVSDRDVLLRLIRYHDDLGIKIVTRVVLERALIDLVNEKKAEAFDTV
jgi:hypothetical protein